ncbi:MAG: DNA polymerase I [Candidatus Omnitrophica bacterium]|nr:DNA polymerase I [Candidatus Omnitrophota bacterium]
MAEIFIIDGTALAYRNYYALPRLTTSTGQPVNAVYGFANSLLKILRTYQLEYGAVAFDVKKPTFRTRLFLDYKAQRPPMPEELSLQLPVIRDLSEAIGLRVLEKEDFEADDIIATVTKIATSLGHQVTIFSSDKDILQLLSSQALVINPIKEERRDLGWLEKNFGIAPKQIIDFLALAGDPSDHIPGVRGIGDKTALKLLKEFKSLEEIYDKLEQVNPPSVREKLRAGYQSALLSKTLVVLRDDVPVTFTLDDFARRPPRKDLLWQICHRLELKKLAEQFSIYFSGEQLEEGEVDQIGFSDGAVVRFSEILRHPEKFSSRLSDEKIGKWGYHLKEKAVKLAKLGVEMAGLVFDFALAQHLTGQVIPVTGFSALKEAYEKLISQQGIEKLFYEVEMPLVPVLVWMETNGILVDTEYLQALNLKMSASLQLLEEKIYQAAGETFNLNSSQQLGRILFEKLRLSPKRKTKTGHSTDTAVLQQLASEHPLPALMLEYREFFKLRSTYIEGLLNYVDAKTGRIHPCFNQLATATGRLSCSQPNLQNLPIRTAKGGLIRKAFKPTPPARLFSFDYNQIELRILAHFSQDPGLVDAFVRNQDIHQETAERLFNSGGLFSPENLQGTDNDLRRLAKTINFGIIYGMSAYGLANQLNIPVEEAQEFIRKYFATFSGVAAYIEQVVETARKNGYVTSFLGRRRYLPEIDSNERQRQEFGRRAAINMPIQSTAAEVIKVAMVHIYNFFRQHSLRSRLLLQIHDELVFEIFPEEEKYLPDIKRLMEKTLPLSVPIRVDIQQGENYLEMEKVCFDSG